MRKKILKVSLIGIVLLVLLLFCACNTSEAKNKTTEEKYFMKYMGYCSYSTHFAEWRDCETGVHYFKSSNGSLCPRYKADGTLYVD